jgi:HTH-type transcriptional regulator / antitoxin HipB
VDYPVKTPLQLRPLLVGFRKAAGLTQAQMASHFGVTQQTYAQIEAKPESASIERLFHILKLLGVDIVLTQPSGPANLKGRTPERLLPIQSIVAKKRDATEKSATSATNATGAAAKTTGTRKAAVKPARGTGPASPKPGARKRVTPMAAARKREDW